MGLILLDILDAADRLNSVDSILDINAPLTLSKKEWDVIQILHNSGPTSRTAIADITQWSKAKVSYEVQSLISRGLLVEVDVESGRPSRLIGLNNKLGYLLGIDIGAIGVHIALADLAANIIQRNDLLIEMQDGPSAILDEIVRCALEMAARQSIEPSEILGVGVGVPGPVDFSQGTLVNPPLMPGWGNIQIQEFFTAWFPRAQIVVDNDANIMALGESYIGDGVGIGSFIYVKMGTGIGAGIIFDGKVQRGANGSAGEIGHICIDRNGAACYCGRRGCLEGKAGAPAIVAQATKVAESGQSPILTRIQRVNNGELQLEDVALAASQGDLLSIDIIKDSGALLGEVLAAIVNFSNPELILLGGRSSILGNQFLASVRQSVLARSNTLATRDLIIKFSSMGNDAGVIGAIHLAFGHAFVVEGTA